MRENGLRLKINSRSEVVRLASSRTVTALVTRGSIHVSIGWMTWVPLEGIVKVVAEPELAERNVGH